MTFVYDEKNYSIFVDTVSVNFPKTLMVLLLCLTFVGQTMASTVMSYHMMNMQGMNAQSQPHDMSKMDSSDHIMVNDVDDQMTDCCAKECNCGASACSTVATISKTENNALIINLSAKIHSMSSLTLSQQFTSLYRPPIVS
jgi:hypothetical protein